MYSFNFEYNERNFEMFTKTAEEAEVWVTCLKFLSEQKSKDLETATSSQATTYFHTFNATNQIS